MVGAIVLVGLLVSSIPLAFLFVDLRRKPLHFLIYVGVLLLVMGLFVHELLAAFGLWIPLAVPVLMALFVLLAKRSRA